MAFKLNKNITESTGKMHGDIPVIRPLKIRSSAIVCIACYADRVRLRVGRSNRDGHRARVVTPANS
ncbi:hypothetical protein A3216_13815 [Mycobacterium leprae 7935681]|nr:hypothetical protein A3216_13815 [Mycobacterium leprae 7935681]